MSHTHTTHPFHTLVNSYTHTYTHQWWYKGRGEAARSPTTALLSFVWALACAYTVTHMHESCHTYETVMSHIWMVHVIHMNESCHNCFALVCLGSRSRVHGDTHACVMWHIWSSPATHMNGRMSRATHVNESCHAQDLPTNTLLLFVWALSCAYSLHDSFVFGTWLIHVCHTTQSCVWYDSFKCVTKLMSLARTGRAMYSYAWHDSFMCVTRLFHVRDMTHSYVWPDSCMCVIDSFMCVMWFFHIYVYSYIWHASFRCVTWLMHVCDMTHSHVGHDSFICWSVTWLIYVCYLHDSCVWPVLCVRHDSFTSVTCLIHKCAMTHLCMCVCKRMYVYAGHNTLTCMTWLFHVCDIPLSYV